MKKLILATVGASALAAVSPAHATVETMTSPTGGALPGGVTQVGGIVVDILGTNDARVVSQLAASQLYRGFSDWSENPVAGVASGNPLLFGTQTGFTPTVVGALGGGIKALSIRITLYDGDTASGNFDYNQNTLSLNNISLGNWSTVPTYITSADGLTLLSSASGFPDDRLATGFFSSTDSALLSSLYGTLSTGSLEFRLHDVDPTDNFYDFTQGVDGGLINVGTGPVITPPGGVPEPSTWAMMILGFGVVGSALRRRKAVQLRYA